MLKTVWDKMKPIGIVLLILMVLLPAAAYADTGPKPSVRIEFLHDGNETYYGTLLAETDGNGPYRVWDGTEEYKSNYNEIDEQVWEKFARFEDEDGFFFWQMGWKCSESGTLNWTYYPPETFKVLLYYPEHDCFVISDIYEQYAFDSYFAADLKTVDFDADSTEGMAKLVLTENYDTEGEAKGLLARIGITIVLELIVAAVFGLLKSLPAVGIILGTNVVTQTALNLALNAIVYHRGSGMIVLWYLLLEILIFLGEAGIYTAAFRRIQKDSFNQKKTVLYALVANGVSFGAGLLLAGWLPNLF